MQHLKPYIPALIVGILIGVAGAGIPMSYGVTDAEKQSHRMAVVAGACHDVLKLAGVPIKE